jgi:hypothetical protein
MLGEGATMAAIGVEVDTWPLPEEQRSALWLLAWSRRPARSPDTANRRSSYPPGGHPLPRRAVGHEASH